MSGEHSSALNLANLPSDIIRHIIKFGIDSINDMKQVSLRWKNLVDDQRSRFPSIEWLSLRASNCATSDGKSGCALTVYMRFEDRFENYFGAKRTDPFNNFDSSNVFELHFIFENDRKERHILNRLRHLFRRCSGIKRLDINMAVFLSMPEYNVALRAMKNLFVDELHVLGRIHFNNTVASALSNVIRRNNVPHLALDVTGLPSDCFSNFICISSHLVPSIELNLSNFSSKFGDLTAIRTSWQLLESNINRGALATANLQDHTLPNGTPSLRLTIKAV